MGKTRSPLDIVSFFGPVAVLRVTSDRVDKMLSKHAHALCAGPFGYQLTEITFGTNDLSFGFDGYSAPRRGLHGGLLHSQPITVPLLACDFGKALSSDSAVRDSFHAFAVACITFCGIALHEFMDEPKMALLQSEREKRAEAFEDTLRAWVIGKAA